MGLSPAFKFAEALPVWEEGRETEMNVSLLFRAVTEGNAPFTLSVAAHTRYQIFINGAFFAAGPARAAHGFHRVNEYTVSEGLTEGKNTVGIIAAGYNANSYYLTDEPAFLCAELKKDGKVTAATGRGGFEAVRFTNRERKVPRYSFQRPFTEVYLFHSLYDSFFKNPEETFNTVPLAVTEEKRFITRTSPYCEYREIRAAHTVATGSLKKTDAPKKFTDRSLTQIGEKLKGFKENELTCCPVNDLYAYEHRVCDLGALPAEPITVGEDSFAIFDMGLNTTGYIRLAVKAEEDTEICAVFNEIRRDPGQGLDPGRDGCENVVRWTLEGGRSYLLISFEPYTYRYIEITAKYAPVRIESVAQIRETYPEPKLVNRRKMPDEALQKIYDAAVETFVQNATDIFMDCPSRERAGWLCDSFFTSRVEKELTGESLVEHDFLENFLMAERFDSLPEGMLPMCYPSDHPDGCFIPNWAMWYVLELREYLLRSGDRELIDAAKKRVYALLGYFSAFENEDGLLEKLESWVFVEWSKANEFVQDINYPSNMIYALVLDAVSELYGDGTLKEKAAAIRETVRRQSFDGEFFRDNAVRDENGRAVLTENHTETCQYYAFFSKTATKETYPELHETLLKRFGPGRDPETEFTDVPVSNAFIGNYLRLQILFSEKEYDTVEKEIRDFFLPMAEQTGTLWENMSDHASCNHGFASHVAVWLNGLFSDRTAD